MRRSILVVLPLLLLAILLATSATPATAQVKEGPNPRNVLVKLTLDRQDPDGKKTSRVIQTVVRLDGEAVDFLEGARVPVPGQGADGAAYTYQNSGISMVVRAQSASVRSVRLHGKIEDTSITGSAAPPVFRTSNLELGDVVVAEEKPLEVAAVKGADGSSVKLVVEVDILD